MEGNTFRPIFFRNFIVYWLLYNFAAGSFHTTKLCGRFYSIKVELYSKLESLRFMWFQNIRSPSFSFVTIHASDRQMDGQIDGQNCDSNTMRCITRSCTVTKIQKSRIQSTLIFPSISLLTSQDLWLFFWLLMLIGFLLWLFSLILSSDDLQ